MTPNEHVVFVQQWLQLFLHRGVGGLGGRAVLHFFYVGYTCSCYLHCVGRWSPSWMFVSVLISGFGLMSRLLDSA